MRKIERILISDADRERLERLVWDRNTPQKLVWRARIVLLASDGLTAEAIAGAVSKSLLTVRRWRRRYMAKGVDGLLKDATRPPGRRPLTAETIKRVVHMTLHDKPMNATQWSARSMAKAAGISYSSVQRIWRAHGLKPHLVKTFKVSRDKNFAAKVEDVVGLYLNPPENALVLCVDEKSQVQALERTQPVLPMGLGYVEGITHDYIRHGTTTLFAALDIANGQVFTQCKSRHRHQEFLSFLRHIEANVPQQLDVHLVIDNYGTHRHARVKAWLARRPRFHVHFTPTYSSWLNQVERWFGLITQRAIRRGSFESVPDLKRKISEFVEHYNQHPKPFMWTATADSILAKLERLGKVICGTSH